MSLPYDASEGAVITALNNMVTEIKELRSDMKEYMDKSDDKLAQAVKEGSDDRAKLWEENGIIKTKMESMVTFKQMITWIVTLMSPVVAGVILSLLGGVP